MEFQDRFESALKSGSDGLIKLADDLIGEGNAPEKVMDACLDFMAMLRNNDREADEELLLEPMGYIAGKCEE